MPLAVGQIWGHYFLNLRADLRLAVEVVKPFLIQFNEVEFTRNLFFERDWELRVFCGFVHQSKLNIGRRALYSGLSRWALVEIRNNNFLVLLIDTRVVIVVAVAAVFATSRSIILLSALASEGGSARVHSRVFYLFPIHFEFFPY